MATLIGALVGIWVAGYLDRRKMIYAAQTEILKRLDACPEVFLDQYLSESRDAIRDTLLAALPYLRESDQQRATKTWGLLKSALDGKTPEKNEFLEDIAEFLGTHVESKEDAFKRAFSDLNTTLANSARLIG
jgi:hypothetical protein